MYFDMEHAAAFNDYMHDLNVPNRQVEGQQLMRQLLTRQTTATRSSLSFVMESVKPEGVKVSPRITESEVDNARDLLEGLFDLLSPGHRK